MVRATYRCFSILVLFAFGLQVFAARTYYVDSINGKDVWSGTLASPQGLSDGPWKTLDRVTAQALVAGDKVLLRRGSVWRNHMQGNVQIRNRLYIKASGAQALPIVVDVYGTGVAPIVSGGRLILRNAPWVGPNASGVYRLDLGSVVDFFTSSPVLVRVPATAASSADALLLRRISTGALTADTYKTSLASGRRILEYMPKLGESPKSYGFEVSVNPTPILVTGNDVRVSGVVGLLAISENPNDPLPRGNGIFRSEGARVHFTNCRASFSGATGMVIRGPDNTIDGCSATYNHSSGLAIEDRDPTRVKGLPAPDRGTIQNSRSEFNGNIEYGDSFDKGGIAVQGGNFATIRKNFVNSNGNVNRATDTEDAAIALVKCHDATVDQNYVVNSARNAISSSYEPESYGHKIMRNVVHNWNLEGAVSTQNTSAIYISPFGNTPNSGRFKVYNNTIYSNQSGVYLVGIHVNIPYTTDFLNNTSIKNNLIYLKGNNHRGTRGLRINKNRFVASVINNNNVYVEGATPRSYHYVDTDFFTRLEMFRASGHEANGINTKPLFVGAAPKVPSDFDLAAGSLEIDRGASVGLVEDYLSRPAPKGLAPDIGAFEYDATRL